MTASETLASGRPFDLVVVGGGVNGAGIALAAAANGLRTALFEADDFGGGTTWRSTRLIHGGLRYLEHREFRLVRESLRERTWLLRTRPHLVQPLRFVLPLVPWTRRPAWQLRLGLAAYDLLGGRAGLPGHRRLSRSDGALRLLPAEARGAFQFHDARAIPERLALELALQARAAGALVLNHAPVKRLLPMRARVVGVAVEAEGKGFQVESMRVVNAAGPWVDEVNSLPDFPTFLGATKGTHIVVEPRVELGDAALISFARTDGRVFFAIPQDGLLLVGTTDERFSGDPGDVRPTRPEVDYLLEEARALLPGLELTQENIRYAFAGLRPLPRQERGPEEAITRRHILVNHGKLGGPGGLYSVVGGKLSTFRPVALEFLRSIGRAAEFPDPAPAGEFASGRLRRYGAASEAVRQAGAEVICTHSGLTRGEVIHAAREELALTLADVLMRRTGAAWAACRGLCGADEATALAGGVLGWDDLERRAQVEAYRRAVAYHLPPLEEVEATPTHVTAG